MANDIQSNVITLITTTSFAGAETITPVSATEYGQRLPDSGRNLPLPAEKSPSRKAILSAVKNLNQYVQAIRRELEFSIDENSGRTVIKVLDAETKEVIRQIPPEEVIVLSRNLKGRESVIFSHET